MYTTVAQRPNQVWSFYKNSNIEHVQQNGYQLAGKTHACSTDKNSQISPIVPSLVVDGLDLFTGQNFHLLQIHSMMLFYCSRNRMSYYILDEDLVFVALPMDAVWIGV